jgi:hypothetical protein
MFAVSSSRPTRLIHAVATALQRRAPARQVTQLARLSGRHETAAQQSLLQAFANPFAVLTIALLAATLAPAGIDQQQSEFQGADSSTLQSGFQCAPVDSMPT